MDNTTHAEPARIDELLAAYRELQAQFDRARDRLRRADENRHTVQRRIYDRVRADYDRELDTLRSRMSPLRDEINRVYESLEAQCREADSALQAVEDELAEAEFRHRTGEYEATTFNGVRLSLDTRAEEARARQLLLRTTLDAIAAMQNPGTVEPAPAPEPVPADPASDSGAATAAPVPVEEPAPAPAFAPGEPEFSAADLETLDHADPPATEEVVPHRSVLNARHVAPAPKADTFENPHDWITEMAPDPARDRRRRDAESAVATEPAAAAAPAPAPAPTPTSASTPEPVAAPAPAPAPNFPSLVFVSGPHAGQSIALLPTTLTIGREHDNNIEIKDPDVARYHARILRQRDQYVVEDLNSSTGTWVNGERKQRAVLTHGDVIRMGQTELALDFEWTAASA